MVDSEELRNMVSSSFRFLNYNERPLLLGFAGRNKSGCKHDLIRALHLLKSSCSLAVQIKRPELGRSLKPRIFFSFFFFKSTFRSSVFSLAGSSSPVEPDLAVAGIHRLPSSSVTSSPSFPVGSVLLQDTKPMLEMQEPCPPIPPAHPDVQLKNLPFYDVLDVLIEPTSLAQRSIERSQEELFILTLTPQQVIEICISRIRLPDGGENYRAEVQLRLCLAETSCPQKDGYLENLSIKVNGKLVPSSKYAPPPPPPNAVIKQRCPGHTVNITSLVRVSSAVPNQISIFWSSNIGKNYSMSAYLVRQLTSATLLKRLKSKGIRKADHSRARIKEIFTADLESEIVITDLAVSLICPLGKMRLTNPCRAETCVHLQCFDAALYLQMNEKNPTWVCPVCKKEAAYENLILDGLLMEILNDCSDVDMIKFQKDGCWYPLRPKKEAKEGSSQQDPTIHTRVIVAPSKHSSEIPASQARKKKLDVTDLPTERCSDEEGGPPAKRRSVTQSSPTKGVLVYQPSSVRLPRVTSVDPAAIPPSLTDYSVPFHHTPISSMSSDLPG
uniref:Protein inhibitor of activated STAT 2 n=1 Tax=Myotis lucifugus TaxID=59463 RepID=G1Q4C9_MYOLU